MYGYASYIESLRIALSSLRANKLRTGLTLIGVVVGVAAVISVVTIIRGLDQTVAATFSSQGSTVFTISKRPQIILSREDFIKYNKRKDILSDDAEAITHQCTTCWRIGVTVNSSATVKHGDQKSDNVTLRGVTEQQFDIDAIKIAAGRAFIESENKGARNVCVIGPDVVKNIFNDDPPERVVGQSLAVNGRRFEVIGVSEKLGDIFGFSRDNFVMIPYETYRVMYGARESLVVYIQVPTANELEAARDQVTSIMRNRRGKTFKDEDNGFTVETQDVFLDLYGKATSNIYIVTIGVAAISLVVGGIVVMNIMLVSVTERTREIGIRKALGARQKDILSQFLIEAVTITSLGGMVGVGVGFGLAYLIALLINFPLLLSITSAILGVAVSSIVGIVSGLWPAYTAARLDPIEALRTE
ncbi:MAG: ABC transporter permease [Pyrinomonadaceae bacterium]